MKIIICGKGGCGKSTIASLLAGEYTRAGKRVLVIDTDESNYGLHRQLGASLPKDFTLYFGSKKGVFAYLDKNDPTVCPFDKRWTFDDIPREYTTENNGIRLMAIGKIHEAGEGCACPMGTLARHFLDNLDLGPDDVVIADMEAGVEHFGRGVDGAADVILMIADPSYESIQLSAKIGEMGKSIGKPVYYVLNKVTAHREALLKSSFPNPAAIITSIPYSDEILSKGLLGQALDENIPEIKEIINFLEQ